MKKYLVGGAVRDKLLGKEPKDRDWVIVGATEAVVKELLAQGYEQVGADFPVFLHPQTNEEYALARVERKTGVGYHGFTVTADENVTIEEDLGRRDLTINSIAMDDEGNFVDPYNGRKDICKRVLRHTTEAFAEDPLRVLRLARFAARFPTWSIAPETIELCGKLTFAGELNHLSIERIWTEMEKGFSEQSPHRFMDVLQQTGAIMHCKVLTEIFGQLLTETQFRIAKQVACVPQDQRLHVSIATMAGFSSDLPGASSRTRECHSNLNMLSQVEFSAQGLLQVLKKARAFQEGPTFLDLVMAVNVLERAGWDCTFTAKQLMTAQRVAREVRASDFPGITGKDLGIAIEGRRAVNLQMCMSIPTSEVAQQLG